VRKALPYFLLPTLAGLVIISKVFFYPDCLAFDTNDDRNHTFLNLFIARSLLKEGHLPLMNLFNNFGTPLVGDALTYPFSMPSLTYWFFEDAVAMTINRFFAAFLTVLLAFTYFRKKMSGFSAGICSLVLLGQFGFLWHIAHHHYQMALVSFLGILLAQEFFVNKLSSKSVLVLSLAVVFQLLNTSINLVILMAPFLYFHHFTLCGFRVNKTFWIWVLVYFSSFLFYYPETWAFLRQALSSARASDRYDPYTTYDLPLVLKSVIGQSAQWRNLLISSIYLSLPVLVLLPMGLWQLWKEHKNNSLFRLIVLAGILPYLAVVLLLYFKQVWWSIPLLRSIQITRILWLGQIFILLGVGIAIDSLRKTTWRSRELTILSGSTFFLLCVYTFALEWQTVSWEFRFIAWVFCAFLLLLTITRLRKIQMAIASILSLWVLVSYIPSYVRNLGLGSSSCRGASHHFHLVEQGEFEYPMLAEKIPPHFRAASEVRSSLGVDLRIERFFILGSGGRSILIDKLFADYLLSQNLIKVDSNPLSYHFKRPWDQEKLARLGIKYVVQKGREKEENEKGWRMIAEEKGHFLYENSLEVSLAYLIQGTERKIVAPHSIQFRGNGIEFPILPLETGQELLLTFTHRPGWTSHVNGKEREIVSREDRLMRVHLQPGDRAVRFSYEPYTWTKVFLGILAWALITFLSGKLVMRQAHAF
jgi:hypothetical protein